MGADKMSDHPFHFHSQKAAQAIATLLRFEPGERMNYYRLLKLLYIADRLSVRQSGRPIIGGRLIAMERGPLHSAALDLVKGKGTDIAEWASYFRTDRYDLEMVDDPGNSELSSREIDLLNAVRQQHEAEDDFEVGKKTHDFQEFLDHQPAAGRVNTIPFLDLLKAVGREDDAALILKDAKDKALFDRVFGV